MNVIHDRTADLGALRTRPGTYVVFIILGIVMCTMSNSMSAEDSDARLIDAAVRWTTELGETLRIHLHASAQGAPKPSAPPPAIAETGREVRETQGANLGNALIYYRAVAACLSSAEDAFPVEIQKARNAGVFQPDLLLYAVKFFGDGQSKLAMRMAAWDEYGRIAPISLDGQDRADRLAPAGKIDPPLPSVPNLAEIEQQLAKIGDLYAASGQHREAANVYIESVFARPFVFWEAKGAAWLKVARIETQLGQSQLALQAYLKATYSDPAPCDQARNGIADLLRTPIPKAASETSEKVPATTAAEIAELYRQCNLHPFALRVLSAAGADAAAKLRDQRDAIEAEWLGIVAKHQRIRGDKCMLLGVMVNEVTSWAEAKILRPSDTYWMPRAPSAASPANR